MISASRLRVRPPIVPDVGGTRTDFAPHRRPLRTRCAAFGAPLLIALLSATLASCGGGGGAGGAATTSSTQSNSGGGSVASGATSAGSTAGNASTSTSTAGASNASASAATTINNAGSTGTSSSNTATATPTASSSSNQTNTAFGTGPTASSSGATTDTTQSALSDFAQFAVDAINRLRASPRTCDSSRPQQVNPAVAPISWSALLAASADDHVRDLQASNTFDHTGSDGSWVGDRISREGYEWATVGEVQAANFNTLAEVITGWSISALHCSTLMDASFTQIGIATIAGTAANTYSRYWTMDLARPR